MARKTILGSKAFKPLGHWSKLLEEWAVTVDVYSRTVGDNCFGYTERTDTGILGAAAWKSGGFAIEEFQWKKSKVGGKSGKGRADLWLTHSARAQKHEYVEAKRQWISLSSEHKLETAEKTLSAAIIDARSTKNRARDHSGVGVAFLPVYIKKSKRDEMSVSIDELCGELLKARRSKSHPSKLKFDAMAWCFPSEDQAIEYEKNITPGIILLARAIPKSR